MAHVVEKLRQDHESVATLIRKLEQGGDEVETHVLHGEEDISPLAEEDLADDEAGRMARQHDTMAKEYMHQHADR